MVDVRLQAWSEAAFDVALDVLRRANTPAMMTHLGGPESEEKLADRQRRYLALDEPGAGQMFVITVDGESAGVVGYWEHEWQGEGAYEAGWSVLPEFQGQGIAGAGCDWSSRTPGGHLGTARCARSRASTTRRRTRCAAKPA